MVAAIAYDFDFDDDSAPAGREGGVTRARPSVALYRPSPAPRCTATRTGHHVTTRRRHRAAVYRRRRVVAAGVLAVVFVGVWWTVRAVVDDAGPAALAPSRPIAARVYVVHPGDTLWGIALASGDKGDIRPLVDELSAQVHDQPLWVGERITLP